MADDVRRWCGALCKGERRPGIGTGAVEASIVKERTKVSRAKTEYMCLNGTPAIWMDCVNRDMIAIGTTKVEVHDITGWRRIVSATATQHPSGSE